MHNLNITKRHDQQSDGNKPLSFVEMGGDSLSAIKLAEEIKLTSFVIPIHEPPPLILSH